MTIIHAYGKTLTEPAMRSDFRVFLMAVWAFLGLPEPTRVQYDLARRLQQAPSNKRRRHIILAFRGVAKSYITSAYVLWRLWNDPQLKVLVVSASKQRADDFSTFTKRLINEMALLAVLKARPNQRDSNVSFDVGPATPAHSPSVKSVGITGQMAGSRADLIVADDVEIPSNSLTQLKRERLIEAVKEFDAVLKPGGEVVFLGTPQIEDSLYNKLQEKGFTPDGTQLYEAMIWPSRYPSRKLREYYGVRLAPLLADDLNAGRAQVGEPTDPDRFDDHDLIERELSYGAAGFALQFMLDTSLSDADRHPLKLSDLIIHDLDLEYAPRKLVWSSGAEYVLSDLPMMGLPGDRFYAPTFVDDKYSDYHGCVMSIDPAGRGKDRVGYAVVRSLNGFLFLTAAGSIEGGYDEDTLVRLATIAAKQRPNKIMVEPNFGQGMFVQLFKPVLRKVYQCSVEEGKRSTVQKEKRVCDVLEPVMARHRLVVDPKVVRDDYEANKSSDNVFHMLGYQLSRMTRERGALRYDDAVDALAMAVEYWTDRLSVDVEKEAKKRADEELDRELRRFRDGIFSTDLIYPNQRGPRRPNMLGDAS